MSSTGTSPSAVATNGKITVLLTDGPGTDWDQAIATITSIELLGDDRNQTLFTGNSTVDLLSLADFYDVFSVTDNIVPGTFEKIRLRVETLVLVEQDDSGNELQRVSAKLVGNGKIDLNPRGDIVVGPGDSLYVELDFDMNKAFKTTTTGNGKVIVRPVVMVNITTVPPVGRLTRIHGVINAIDADEQEFTLCQEGLVSAMDEDDEDDDHQHCTEVTTDSETGLFGADGLPIEFEALMVGDLATAVGHLRREDDDDDEDDDDEDDDDEDDEWENDIFLHAVTVELGEDFRRVSGVADGPVNGDVFDLALTPGQELGTDDAVLSTQLFAKTRIFRKNGEELDRNAIAMGVGVLADGVLIPADDMADTLRAALLILDLDLGSAEEVLRGEIVSVNVDAGTLQLFVGDSEQCVNANNADIFSVSNIDGFSSERVGLADLAAMQAADVFGSGQDDSGCFLATDILASSVAGNTLPVADAGEAQTVTAGESVMLDGTGSSDADADGLSYTWVFESVPDESMAVLAASDTAMPSFIADVAGSYVVELIVYDGMEDSAPDTVTVTAE